MNKKPLILVTNDDGIVAPGIKKLIEIARHHGEVVVIAPDAPQSGKGHAITIEEPIRINEVEAFPGIRSYECSGTPVDCVKLAKNVILKDREIDLCVSGINHGSNASVNILYSGTVSAAMEASMEGIDSIAFSLLDYSFDADMDAAEDYIHEIFRYVLSTGLTSSQLLNVNIPKLSKANLKGIRVCRQAIGSWEEEFQHGKDPRGQDYYWLTGKFICKDEGADTDIYALENGYISIVPSGHDLTEYNALNELAELSMNEIKTPVHGT